MTVPTCPLHHKPMRVGKNGTHYCATKLDDGSWCKEKPPVQASPSPSVASVVPTFAAATPSTHLLILGALDAAAKVFQGTSDSQGFLFCASQIFEDWKGNMS